MTNWMIMRRKENIESKDKYISASSQIPQSRFIPSEKMPELIERIIKIEEKYPGEDYFTRKKRENRSIDQLYYMAVKEGLDGKLKKYVKNGIILGTTFCAVFTNFDIEAVAYSAVIFGTSSFVAASLVTYREIKEEALRIRKAIREKIINQQNKI